MGREGASRMGDRVAGPATLLRPVVCICESRIQRDSQVRLAPLIDSNTAAPCCRPRANYLDEILIAPNSTRTRVLVGSGEKYNYALI